MYFLDAGATVDTRRSVPASWKDDMKRAIDIIVTVLIELLIVLIAASLFYGSKH